MNYTAWVAAERTTVYTSLVDRGMDRLNFQAFQVLISDFLLWWVGGKSCAVPELVLCAPLPRRSRRGGQWRPDY